MKGLAKKGRSLAEPMRASADWMTYKRSRWVDGVSTSSPYHPSRDTHISRSASGRGLGRRDKVGQSKLPPSLLGGIPSGMIVLGAAAPKPPLAIPPPSKLGGILATLVKMGWQQFRRRSDVASTGPARAEAWFGRLWRTYLGGPHSEIGWALEEEKGFCANIQSFERGFIFRDSTVRSCLDERLNESRTTHPNFAPLFWAVYGDETWRPY